MRVLLAQLRQETVPAETTIVSTKASHQRLQERGHEEYRARRHAQHIRTTKPVATLPYRREQRAKPPPLKPSDECKLERGEERNPHATDRADHSPIPSTIHGTSQESRDKSHTSRLHLITPTKILSISRLNLHAIPMPVRVNPTHYPSPTPYTPHFKANEPDPTLNTTNSHGPYRPCTPAASSNYRIGAGAGARQDIRASRLAFYGLPRPDGEISVGSAGWLWALLPGPVRAPGGSAYFVNPFSCGREAGCHSLGGFVKGMKWHARRTSWIGGILNTGHSARAE